MAGRDDRTKYSVDADGVMRVRKVSCRRIGGYETFLPEREYEYPCMEMDGDVFFLMTLIGGWFGLHKFMTRHYLAGLLYALTCGFCGVFYVCDLLAIISGNYADERVSFVEDEAGRISQRRERFYNRPVGHRKMAFVGVLAAIVVAVVMARFVYIPVLVVASQGILGFQPSEDFLKWMVQMWM